MRQCDQRGMSSTRKIEANRANAQASTGPCTARGKARASQNARRHGLSVFIGSDPMLSDHIKSLAQEIAGETTDREVLELARCLAEAEIDLIRIRRTRHQFLAHNINDPNFYSEPDVRQGPQKLAASVTDYTKELVLIDRYEQRARSRRKFAIRAYDLARRQAMRNHGAPLPTADSN